MPHGLPHLLAALVLACLAPTVRAAGEANSPPAAPPATPANAAAPTVLRYAFRVAETGFDPAGISDLYSRTIAANLYEAPYQYEFLARPVRLRPATAAALPGTGAGGVLRACRVRGDGRVRGKRSVTGTSRLSERSRPGLRPLQPGCCCSV